MAFQRVVLSAGERKSEATAMQLQIGEHIRTSDGKDAGKIRYLIIDPASHEVRAVVLERGVVLPDHLEIPLSELATAPDSPVRLRRRADEMDEYPHFDDSAYTSPPPGIAVAGFPVAALLWPVAAAPSPEWYQEEQPSGADLRDQPMGTIEPPAHHDAVVREGADVVTRDGVKVGQVATISFDTATGRPIRLKIRRGLLGSGVDITGEHIQHVEDELVRLDLDQSQFDEWRRSQSQSAA